MDILFKLNINYDKSMKKYFLPFLISQLLGGYLFAQTSNTDYDEQKVIPPSPGTAQFQKYGDYSVSGYTGVPGISVPLYTIKAGDITVPIYLSYHASGTKVDEIRYPNIVGLGWTLQVGGVISREIRGVPDEAAVGGKNFDGFTDYSNSYDAMREIESGQVDNEYDLYSYNFLGRSGKFLDNTGENGYEAFRITYDQLKFSSNFQVRDEAGRGYTFGGADATEYQEAHNAFSALKVFPSTWHLKEMTSATTSASVSYEYVEKNFVDRMLGSVYMLDDWLGSDVPVFDSEGNLIEVLDMRNYYKYAYLNGNNLVLPQQSFIKLRSKEKTVHKISFPNGYILFQYSSGNSQLNRVDIFDSKNVKLKSILLEQEGFYSGGPSIKLKSVIFKDANDQELEKYSFDYIGENASIGTTGLGKDHWGFYNGTAVTGDNYKMQYTFVNRQGYAHNAPVNRWVSAVVGGTADRSVSTENAKIYVLSKITYPTKGYTQFEYEGNKALGTVPVGGLRVKTISNYLENGFLSGRKQYSYSDGGGLEVSPAPDLYRRSTNVIFGNGTDVAYDAHRINIYDNSLIDLAPKGSPIGYSTVIEFENDKWTQYSYDNDHAYEYSTLNYPGYAAASADMSDYRYTPFSHYYRPWRFGNLQFKITNAPGATESESYGLEEVILDTTHDLAFERSVYRECGMHPQLDCSTQTENSLVHSPWIRHSSVYNYARKYYLSGMKRATGKINTISNSDGRSVINTTEYFYDNPAYPMQVSREKSIDSKGNEIITQNIYASDSVSNNVYASMVEANRQDVIRATVYENGNFVTSTYTRFKDWGNGFIAPEYVEVKHGNTAPAIVMMFNSYLPQGNIAEQQKPNGSKEVYLWGYNYQLPVAKIVGSDYQTINGLISQLQIDNATGSSGSDALLRGLLNNLRSSFTNDKKVQVYSYTYSPLIGMTSETDPKGITTYYEYDAAGRLKTIKDNNQNILKRICYNYAGQ